jgi:CRISPR/Cas system-associated exonuclease Cas4 (RecB family)
MVEHTVWFNDPVAAAGTTDYWGGMSLGGHDMGLCVMDLKSSKKPQRQHELQIGAYALGLKREGKTVDTGLIPYVRSDSSEMVILEEEELADRSLAFIEVAKKYYKQKGLREE